MKSLSKAEIRQEMLTKRRALDKDEYRAKSNHIIKAITTLLHNRCAGLYVPIKKEVDTRSLSASCFPRIEGNIFRYYQAQWNELQKGNYGILEPPKSVPLKPEIILVPGLAFDLKGNRIGSGFGFFDRSLKEQKGLKIGLAFDFQIVDQFAVEKWDIPVDMIISEKKVFTCP